MLAQVFVGTGPLFGVNEESISAVSPKNVKEWEEIFIWDPLLWKLALLFFLSIDWARLWARIHFFCVFFFFQEMLDDRKYCVLLVYLCDIG